MLKLAVQINKILEDTKGIEFGICKVSISPMRRSPDDKSEMVSQLLFGEPVTIFSKKGKNWLKIVSSLDEYIGWVDEKQIIRVSEKEHNSFLGCTVHAFDWVHGAVSNNKTIPITTGACLYNFDGLTFKLPYGKFQYSGQIINVDQVKKNGDLIVKIAKHFLHAPYLWGGRSPFGIDCSGFTQVVFKFLGIRLPRDSNQQVNEGRMVDFNHEARQGDLAYFVNKDNKVIHVGIIIEESKIIHASGSVRIDTLDHFGIYNAETKSYSHVLKVIKRILPEDSVSLGLE